MHILGYSKKKISGGGPPDPPLFRRLRLPLPAGKNSCGEPWLSGRAFDCRSRGPRFNSECALVLFFFFLSLFATGDFSANFFIFAVFFLLFPGVRRFVLFVSQSFRIKLFFFFFFFCVTMGFQTHAWWRETSTKPKHKRFLQSAVKTAVLSHYSRWSNLFSLFCARNDLWTRFFSEQTVTKVSNWACGNDTPGPWLRSAQHEHVRTSRLITVRADVTRLQRGCSAHAPTQTQSLFSVLF